VRATLASLPPPLYQDPLLRRADAVAILDGRRRCIRSSIGAAGAADQLSLSSSGSFTG
jgi:hypothetical protein